MIEGRIYINQHSGGFYECTTGEGEQGIALMSLVACGYEGKDPKRQAVFLDDPESVAEWRLATDAEITDEIVRAKKVIKNDYETIEFWKQNIAEMEATNAYLEGKKPNVV